MDSNVRAMGRPCTRGKDGRLYIFRIRLELRGARFRRSFQQRCHEGSREAVIKAISVHETVSGDEMGWDGLVPRPVDSASEMTVRNRLHRFVYAPDG